MLRSKFALKRIANNAPIQVMDMPVPSQIVQTIDERTKNMSVKVVPLTDEARFHKGVSVQDMKLSSLISAGVVLGKTPSYGDNLNLQDKSDLSEFYGSEEFADEMKARFTQSSEQVVNPQTDGAVQSATPVTNEN